MMDVDLEISLRKSREKLRYAGYPSRKRLPRPNPRSPSESTHPLSSSYNTGSIVELYIRDCSGGGISHLMRFII